MRRAEERDRRSRESLAVSREFIDRSIDMFCIANFEGFFTFTNPACTSILGYTPEEMQAEPFLNFVHPDDREPTLREMATLSEGIDTVAFDNRFRCKENSYKTIQWHSRPDVDQSLIYAVGRDVTELRAAQFKQHEGQRRESLGVLAGGVAHDFNNILVGIIGNADLLTRHLGDSPEAQMAAQIELSGRRAADLTRQILAYSGKGKFVVEPLSLSELVRELAPLLESVISKKAELTMTCPADVAAVQGDVTQIRQVVMNLITNASDSLDDRPGKISVIVGEVTADADYLSQFDATTKLSEGRYVFVEVSDTGRGMDASTKERIFDPYYTTKFTGSGLGLAAVRGIVEGHEGALRISTEPGFGSSFKLILPATASHVRHHAPFAPATLPEHLDVLLADDEDIVRALTKQMLTISGCTVTEARDGIEAVSVFQQDPKRFNCVILDLMMPGLSGDAAFEQIRQACPGVPVVISSGYNSTEVRTRFAETEATAFLQKPFGRDELNAAVAEATRGRVVAPAVIQPEAFGLEAAEMDDVTKHRLASNESLFRSANEHMNDAAKVDGRSSEHEYEFLCECSDTTCVDRLRISLPEYEAIRADGRRFALAHGHALIEIEKVVIVEDSHDVVEKFGLAGDDAQHADPRTPLVAS
ncbi:MAG: hybrid sensor histidine kinase/response regulator [Gaiellaceae bacterium]